MAVHQLPRALRIGALGLFLAVAACASDDPLITGDNSPTATGDQSAIGMAASAACSADLATLNVAIEAYTAIFGNRPTSEADLVGGGLLNKESPLYEVSGDGLVVSQSGSECAAPGGPATTVAQAATASTAPAQTLASQQCLEDATVLNVAVLAHLNAGGQLPVTQAELVEEGYLPAVSAMHDLGADGQAFAVPGGGCG